MPPAMAGRIYRPHLQAAVCRPPPDASYVTARESLGPMPGVGPSLVEIPILFLRDGAFA